MWSPRVGGPVEAPFEPRADAAQSGQREAAHGAGPRAPLHLVGSRGIDVVQVWKRAVGARTSRQMLEQSGKPRVTLEVTFGFLLAVALASCSGPDRSLHWLPFLLSAALGHELPRAVLARLAGRSANVTVDAWGGRTELPGPAIGAALLAGMAVVGSLSNFLIAGLLLATVSLFEFGQAATSVHELAQVHGLWGVGQLLPLLPFGFGRLLAQRLEPRERLGHAAASLAVGLLLGAMLVEKLGSPLVFFGLLLWVSFSCQRIYEALAVVRDERVVADGLVGDVESSTLGGDPERTVKLANQLLDLARSSPLRVRALKALTWSAIAQDDPLRAHATLLSLPVTEIDLHLLASYLMTCRRFDEATELLQLARRRGLRSVETTKLLAELYFQKREFVAVAELAEADRSLLSAADLARIESALRESREAAPQSTRTAPVADLTRAAEA